MGRAASAVVCSLVLAANGAAATQRAALTVRLEPMPLQLVVPTDRLELGYTIETAGVTAARGDVFVRDDRTGYVRLPLALGSSTANGRRPRLHVVVPARLLHGGRLFFYAVVTDPASGATATLPAGGAAAPQRAWILHAPNEVRIGVHRFGRTAPPRAVVAHAAAASVGWDLHASPPAGPQTFLVARDHSVWLEDEVAHRMLVFAPGSARPRTVPLPHGLLGDVAFGPRRTLYVTRWHQPGFVLQVLRVDATTGQVLWQSRAGPSIAFNTPLEVAPDGELFARIGAAEVDGGTAEEGWLPLATAAGAPVPPVQQPARTSWGLEPLPDGRHLVAGSYLPYRGGTRGSLPREWRAAVLDRRGTVAASWQVRSGSGFSAMGLAPSYPGGDVLVDLLVSRVGAVEHVVLRLGPHGIRASRSLPLTIFGDYLFPDVRVGPDGDLYRLATSRRAGVTISRYALGPG